MPTMQWGKLTVEFDYQPHEGRTFEHPGCDEEVTVEDVLAGEVSLSDELTWSAYKQVEEDALYYVWEKIREERKNREEN